VDNKVLIPAKGGLDLIIQTMKMHSTHTGVQEQACGVLQNLAMNAENEVLITRNGAMDMILQAMINFPHESTVQEKACAALKNLATNRSPPFNSTPRFSCLTPSSIQMTTGD
jgi:hypothetical protein